MTKRKKPSEAHMFVYVGLSISSDRLENAKTIVAQLQGMKEFPDSEDFIEGLDVALLDALYTMLDSTSSGIKETMAVHMGKRKDDI